MSRPDASSRPRALADRAALADLTAVAAVAAVADRAERPDRALANAVRHSPTLVRPMARPARAQPDLHDEV